jgi:hypothetical protein
MFNKTTYFLVLGLVYLTSCTRVDLEATAHKSDKLRTLLARYYIAHTNFPGDFTLLKELDPHFETQGGLWNGWDYTAYDPGTYDIWCYPSVTRQSLWFKMNVNDPAETGWFINNDDGIFINQHIPILPLETNILQQAVGH